MIKLLPVQHFVLKTHLCALNIYVTVCMHLCASDILCGMYYVVNKSLYIA